jgi:hypothetical protein
MSVYQASKGFLTSSVIRTAIRGSRWSQFLIAVIVVDSLLAVGAWVAVGCIIGE